MLRWAKCSLATVVVGLLPRLPRLPVVVGLLPRLPRLPVVVSRLPRLSRLPVVDSRRPRLSRLPVVDSRRLPAVSPATRLRVGPSLRPAVSLGTCLRGVTLLLPSPVASQVAAMGDECCVLSRVLLTCPRVS